MKKIVNFIKKNATAVACISFGLMVLGLSLGDALSGHGVKGNTNLNPLIVGSGGSGSDSGSGSSGSGGGDGDPCDDYLNCCMHCNNPFDDCTCEGAIVACDGTCGYRARCWTARSAFPDWRNPCYFSGVRWHRCGDSSGHNCP